MRVLVAQRKSRLLHTLQSALKSQQFVADVTANSETALELASFKDYDVIIIDLLLPELAGLSLVRRLRALRVTSPILVVTGNHSTRERIAALVAGADAYVIRPASIEEIMVYVRVLLRRPKTLREDMLHVADLELDRVRQRVVRNGVLIRLTPREYKLLEYLMCNVGKALSRPQLVDHVWNETFDRLTNIVDVYINYLRAKIDRGFSVQLIQTVYGVGYVMVASAQSAPSHATPFLVDAGQPSAKRTTPLRARPMSA
jgi:two-component system copper resistance phosphate regulon response regulator CusR